MIPLAIKKFVVPLRQLVVIFEELQGLIRQTVGTRTALACVQIISCRCDMDIGDNLASHARLQNELEERRTG
jgi:hypothetical protein